MLLSSKRLQKMDTCFKYVNNFLNVNEIPLQSIPNKFDTPCYVYAADQIEANLQNLRNVLSKVGDKLLVCFAMKANSNLSIIKLLVDMNCGVDCVSMGEIRRALQAGVDKNKIVFSGVGKTKSELIFAISTRILQINVESIEELEEIYEIAIAQCKVVEVVLRVNTKTDAQTHNYLTTARGSDKFGIDIGSIVDVCSKFKDSSSLSVVGLSCHLGSQITDADVYAEAFIKMGQLIQQLSAIGIRIKTLDVGGGIAVPYKEGDTTLNINQYATLIENLLSKFGFIEKLIIEPGRFLVANAGCLISRVIRKKATEEKTFLIIDAGMNDLIRPCLYQAFHRILPVFLSDECQTSFAVVGPVCESSDTFCENVSLPQQIKSGDYVAIMDVGAYGFSMSSRYNSRQLPVEILVKGDCLKIIGERETLDDALKREISCVTI